MLKQVPLGALRGCEEAVHVRELEDAAALQTTATLYKRVQEECECYNNVLS